MRRPHSTERAALRCLAQWTVAASALATVGVSDGFTGFAMRMPDGPATASLASGLRVDIDSQWFDSGGYRPIRFRFSTDASVGRDRLIELEISHAKRVGRSDPVELTVTKSVVLPARAREIEVEVLFPSYGSSGFYWWDIKVEGERDRYLSLRRGSARFVNPAVANGDPIDLRQLKLRPPAGRPPAGRTAEMRLPRRSRIREFPVFAGLSVDDATADAADNWIEYSSADVVRLPYALLLELTQRGADEVVTLRRWCAAGGAVWIESTPPAVESLQQIADAMQVDGWSLDLDTPPGVTLQPVDDAAGWFHETLMVQTASAAEKVEQLAEELRAGDVTGAVDAATGGPDSRGWYAVRGVGLGRLMAFRQEGFDMPGRLSGGVARDVAKRWGNRGWSKRHGVQPGVSNADFAEMLIPGVGFAPVGEFQVLITLFVLAIGPLNYWLLWRAQRLDLLVVTTPLGALAVTAALFMYATLSDGFGVRARVRSLTAVNQTQGEVVNWARVCHYSGLGSRGNFVLPDDATVYPITPGWESAVASPRSAPRVLSWRDQAQELFSGWAPARTSVQHLVVRSGPFAGRLDFAGTASESLRVRNALGADLELLLAKDEAGQWWIGRGVEVDAPRALEAIGELEAIGALRELTLDNEPEVPIGAGRQVETALEKLGAGRRARRLEDTLAQVSLGGNLMNRAIDRVAGLEGGAPLSLPRRSYVAVSDRSVAAPLGFDRVAEAGSFHMTVGSW